MGWWKIFSLLVLVECVWSVEIVPDIKGKTNLKLFIKRHKLDIVLYYTTWCPHCKRLMPVFEDGALKAHADIKSQFVHFAKVDCSNRRLNGKACRQEKIRGYPTVLPYRNGKRLREIFLLKAEHYAMFAQLLQSGKIPQFNDMHEKVEMKKCLATDEEKWKKKMKE